VTATIGDKAFEAAVAAAFSFLVTRYDFTRRPLRVIAYERYVAFEKPGVKVTVVEELWNMSWVQLETTVSPIPNGRRSFGMGELEQELERIGRYRPVAGSDTVECLAEVLEQIGSDILNGDFSVLFERSRRHVEAVLRNSARTRGVSGYSSEDIHEVIFGGKLLKRRGLAQLRNAIGQYMREKFERR
jgi:hypothetical protein